MKNILLATSILALSASAAFADMKVEVGGHVNSYAAFSKQSRDYRDLADDGSALDVRDSKYTSTTNFLTDAEVSVKASDTADTGLGYGAEVVISTDNTNDTTGEKLKFKSTKLFVATDMGKVEFGGAKSSADQLTAHVPTLATTGSIASVAGSVNGHYDDFVRTPGFDSDDKASRYVTGTNLPSSDSSRKRYANKLVFITPKFSGFQAAISYMPDADVKGTYNSIKSRYVTVDDLEDLKYRNIINAALSFEHEFDGVKLDASIAGESGDAKHEHAAADADKLKDLSAWQAALKLTMDEFALGVLYGDHGKSGQWKVAREDKDLKKTKYWAAGLTWNNNGLGLGVNTFQGKREGNKTSAYSFGADYMLAKGLVTYADLTFFKFKPLANGDSYQLTGSAGGVAKRNKGHVLLVGAKVNF